jgi:dual specificity phosphatase 12
MGQMKNVEAIIENKLYLGKLVASGIFPWVYSDLFASVVAARSTRTLTERRITHILSACNEAIPAEVPESGICHKRISIEDIEYADLLIHLPSACQFIHQALTSGGTVLVHSVNGISRSAAIVVAYCE